MISMRRAVKTAVERRGELRVGRGAGNHSVGGLVHRLSYKIAGLLGTQAPVGWTVTAPGRARGGGLFQEEQYVKPLKNTVSTVKKSAGLDCMLAWVVRKLLQGRSGPAGCRVGTCQVQSFHTVLAAM
jgi:hypothetical protein